MPRESAFSVQSTSLAKHFIFDTLKLLTMRETASDEIPPKSQRTLYKDWATTGKEDKASFPKLIVKAGHVQFLDAYEIKIFINVYFSHCHDSALLLWPSCLQ